MVWRVWCIIAACLLPTACSGCASFWHDLQPHRLRRLNYTSPPHVDPEFTWVDPPTPAEQLIVRAQNFDPRVIDAGL